MSQIYLRALSSLIIISLRLPASLSAFQMSEPEEYCYSLSEHFQPRCPKNEVIIMKSAVFGRMRIGRCIKAEEVAAHKRIVGDDPNYFGCSHDVLTIMDEECSGQSECDVRLPKISDKDIHPCFPGLTVYLEASYECISIADEERSCGLVASADPIHIIGSSVSKRTCGTKSQPWIVEAPVGQRLSVGLLDFTASIEDNTSGQRKQPCTNYGVIMDTAAKTNLSICGGDGIRDKEVHISRGNEISIIFNSMNEEEEPDAVARRFLLAISSIGCSDLIPPEDAWLKRNDDAIVIGCYSSRQTWHLNCQEGNWVGVFGNCSQEVMAHDPVQDSGRIKAESWSDGQVLAMVAIGGLTLAVCLTISCAGIICFRRVSARKKNDQEYRIINYTICSTKTRQQLDEMNLSPNGVTGFIGNGGIPDVGVQQQMPTYSVFVGENGFNDVT